MNALRTAMVGLAAADLAVGLGVGGATAANATTEYPSVGGTWNYGVDYLTLRVWSNYHHPSRVHSSMACSASACKGSGWVPAGLWSYAERQATWGGNTAYYNVS